MTPLTASETAPAHGAAPRPISARVSAGLSVACGLAAAFAHPPFGFIPGLGGFALLLWLIDRSSAERPLRSAFFRAWLAGFAYFLVGLWWISEAFMVDVAAHGWQAPFAVGFLAGGLALLWGAAGLAYRALAPAGAHRVLVFAAVFSLAEWLRGHILTGLPWDLIGETWRAGSPVSQAASVLGVYGLTLLTLMICAGLALMADPDGQARRVGPLVALAVLGLVWLGGAVRLAQPTPVSTGPIIRIVQANVPQTDKWDLQTFSDILTRYARLTAQPVATGPLKGALPDVVVWSETAIPALIDDYLAPGAWTRDVVAQSLQPGQVLITGADRETVGATGRRDYNSLFVLRREPSGFRRLAVYDKHHLVPFGEYFPVDSLAEATGLKRLVHVGDGFTPGPDTVVMRPAGLPALAPMICYESLFPRAIDDQGRRAAWIVNVSNDAWFGKTSGPLQHLNIASYRAIEEGLPMVRATPTGVSAMIDPLGRPIASLGQGAEGVIDVRLPPPGGPTIYHNLGDVIFWVVIITIFIHPMVEFFHKGRGAALVSSSCLRRTKAILQPKAPRDS